MAFYQTCRHCQLEKVDCARRMGVAAKIKGLGLTSVKFRCKERVELYQIGQRVTVTWPVYPEDWRYEDGFSLESWPATVTCKTLKGFIVRVDDVDSDHDTPAREYIKNANLFCNVSPSRLAALDEPARHMCDACMNPTDASGQVPDCHRASGEYTGPYCLNVIRESEEPQP